MAGKIYHTFITKFEVLYDIAGKANFGFVNNRISQQNIVLVFILCYLFS